MPKKKRKAVKKKSAIKRAVNKKKKPSIKKTLKKAVAKKKTVKKLITKKKTTAKPAIKKAAKSAVLSKVEGQVIGAITHYYPHVNAAVLKASAPLKVGDTIRVKGHTTDFKEVVNSIQIDRVPITEAKKGDEIGLLVNSRVRSGDIVYKI